MKEQLNKLKEFNNSFHITDQDFELRFLLMDEENREYLQACKDGNRVEMADALGDMLYVLCGTILNHGMEDVIDDVFKEIHRSNMSKLDSDGKPIFNGDRVKDETKPIGKILKGPNYSEPNIEGILNGTYRPVKRYIKMK